MSIRRFFPFLFVLASAGAAHATPADDFLLGTAVKVESATVDTGNGPRTSTGSSRILKEGKTFDFALRAADLGVALPITIKLRGTLLTSGRIQFDVDTAYSPPIDLGGGQSLSGVTGRIIMRALPVLGIERHDIGNVRLELAAASNLVASGTWGRTTIAIGKLYLLGGIPQPALSSFSDPSTAIICSGRAPVYRLLRVVLTDAASATGAVVELDEVPDAGVRVPPAIVVQPGARTGYVRARIEPGFFGRVRLSAAARGITSALDLDVRASTECLGR